MNLAGVEVDFRTHDPVLLQVSVEILSSYDFDSVGFERGDVVVDVGAHKGGIALYLAKRWPVRVLAFEPEPENFAELHVGRQAQPPEGHRAPLPQGRHRRRARPGDLLRLAQRRARGMASPCAQRLLHCPLDHAGGDLPQAPHQALKLLKLDCEGAEHEILKDAKASGLLKKVDHVRGELHSTPALREAGYDIAGTGALVERRREVDGGGRVIDIVVPTIPGREDSLERLIESFDKHTPDHDITWYIVKDSETCGMGWREGLERSDAPYVLLACDDQECISIGLGLGVHRGGRARASCPARACGCPNGRLESNGGDMDAFLHIIGRPQKDWTPVDYTTVPFMSRSRPTRSG